MKPNENIKMMNILEEAWSYLMTLSVVKEMKRRQSLRNFFGSELEE